MLLFLVSYVKENRTWDGSGERLVEFWEYLVRNHGLITSHILLTIGILGIKWIGKLLQESLPEDILALSNLFSMVFLKNLYPRDLCQTIISLILQTLGTSMITHH